MKTVTIHSTKKAATVHVPAGSILLDVLRSHTADIYAPCGGAGTCGKCLVYIRNRGQVTSCLHPVDEDMDVVLPEQAEMQVLASQHELLRELPASPGNTVRLSARPFGAAIDLGTSTLAFHFIDLMTGSLMETRTASNPQSKYGADVISRIHYCITIRDGLETLQAVIRDATNCQLRNFIRNNGLSADDIVSISIAGNTTMLHILLGIHPEPLAFAPFSPAYTGARKIRISEAGLLSHPEGVVTALPFFSAYVGADVVAGIASIDPQSAPENYLFVDIGTNGEMALVTPEKIYCCSAAAGPAFEGANITNGMAAITGAISRYRGPGEFFAIGNAAPLGICGSGLIDATALLIEKGIIREDGFMEDDAVLVPAAMSGTTRDIKLTPADIREIQLAKSAIAAGIALLMRHAGCRPEGIGAVYLAGGLGNYLQPRSAVGIGLFPRELEGKIIPVGNTSASGAMLALKSESFGRCLDEILSRMELFELFDHPEFLDEFTGNLAFPDDSRKID